MDNESGVEGMFCSTGGLSGDTLGNVSGVYPTVDLSVIIPNFNHGALIGEAIRAAAEQVPAPSEIIVIDDASTDNSLEVLDRLQVAYPALRVVALPKNEGVIRALNRGLHEARGAYIYFGAADDLTKPGLFSATFGVASKYPNAAFVSAEAEIVDMATGARAIRPVARPSNHAKHFAPNEVAQVFRRMDNWILTNAAVVRRDLIVAAGGLDPSLGAMADAYALRRLAFRHGCCFVPFVGAVWQVRAEGVSRTQAADPSAVLGAIEHALSAMRADSSFPSWYPELFERRWRFGVSRLAALARPMNRAILIEVGARGSAGISVLSAAAAVEGRLGQFIALIWMTLSERPISLRAVLATWLSRRLSK